MPSDLSVVTAEFGDTVRENRTRRAFKIPDSKRPSLDERVVLESQQFATQIVSETGLGQDHRHFMSWLADTFKPTGRAEVQDLGKVGTKEVYVITINPQNNGGPGLRVKYAVNSNGAMELWKGATFAESLARANRLGFGTLRDWTSSDVKLRGRRVVTYVVEIEGSTDLNNLLHNSSSAAEAADAATKFFKEFSWNHLNKDGTGPIGREHAERIITTIDTLLTDCPTGLGSARRAQIYTDAKSRLHGLLYDGMPVSPIVGDPRPRNVISINGTSGYKFAWTDAGWPKRLYPGSDEVNPVAVDRAHLGLMPITLGAFVASISDLSNVPDEALQRLRSSFDVLTSYGTHEPSSDPLYHYDPTKSKDLIRRLFTLGQISALLRNAPRVTNNTILGGQVEQLLQHLYSGEAT